MLIYYKQTQRSLGGPLDSVNLAPPNISKSIKMFKNFVFSYLEKMWENLDPSTIPAFVIKDEDGKRTYLNSLTTANPFGNLVSVV